MKLKCKILIVITMLCLCCVAGIFYCFFRIQKLTVSNYSVLCAVSDTIRVVHLTDLHNAEFGEDNCELISLVSEQAPDLIVMTGDMLNRDDESLDTVCSLISSLVKIAPVYFGYGNHETDWEAAWGKDLTEPLSEAGAVVLNNGYIDIEVNEQSLRIGGYMGYYRQPGMVTADEEQKALELAFADEFEDTDRFKILLNHIPTAWVDWGYIDKFPVDIVFSGHYHGGLIRIPIIERGVYAPYVGLFPPYTKGVYSGSQATCVLSAGLGSEHVVPRINNPAEVVVVDLEPSG